LGRINGVGEANDRYSDECERRKKPRSRRAMSGLPGSYFGCWIPFRPVPGIRHSRTRHSRMSGAQKIRLVICGDGAVGMFGEYPQFENVEASFLTVSFKFQANHVFRSSGFLRYL
jgi:hypothetical protein